MKRICLLLIVCLALGVSCKTEKPVTTLKVNLSSLAGEELSVYNIEKDIHSLLSAELDSVSLDIAEELILDLAKGWQHSYIHIKPGDVIHVDTFSASPLVFAQKGELSKENQYLLSFQKISDKISEDYMLSEVTKLPVDSFIMAISSKNAPLTELVGDIENDSEVSQYFKNAMQARMIGNTTNDFSYYKGMYQRHYEKDPTLPSDFYAAFENSKMNDPINLIFDESRQSLSFYQSKDLDYTEFDSVSDFFEASINNVEKVYGKSLVTDFVVHEQLTNMINFSGGLDGTDELISNFKSSVTNKYLISDLDKTIEPWKPLVSGKVAPDFKANTRDGNMVKLSELKGKKVYVDVWATWCGPCIAEIPALKELEKDLHGEIEFVSVSIDDDKDKEKWKKFIEDRSLTGLQWMADGAWQSDVATAYNIQGIPRFLFIDEEGKIVSANAPRPSSANIKETLLN